MTATEDRLARRQNHVVVASARVVANQVTDAWIADTMAELEEADADRDRLAEAEIRIAELTEEVRDVTESRDSWRDRFHALERQHGVTIGDPARFDEVGA
ncbi:hypothetical protein AB0K45_09720 [Micrococcus luteus]|uniref:hypothetical protein n=1 Tax=Micrococcus luteus TaxID=1270 RepID=UPI00341FA295